MGKVVSVNISEKKGVVKHPVEQIMLTKTGIEGDAHAGNWNRQVSLLSSESIQQFQQKLKREISWGEFAENITTQGIDLKTVHPLDILAFENGEIQITQIGKKCHGSNCAIFQEVGDCVMPSEGIFARVTKPCQVKAKDTVHHIPKTYNINTITLSDRASKGEYEDISGKILVDQLKTFFDNENRICKITQHIIPDEKETLLQHLNGAIQNNTDIVITTGGTGVGPRDITPDIVLPFIDKDIPGIMDHIRLKYGANKPSALVSRSVAGVKNKTLIFALPGSKKAVIEYFNEIKFHFFHLLYMLNGLDVH